MRRQCGAVRVAPHVLSDSPGMISSHATPTYMWLCSDLFSTYGARWSRRSLFFLQKNIGHYQKNDCICLSLGDRGYGNHFSRSAGCPNSVDVLFFALQLGFIEIVLTVVFVPRSFAGRAVSMWPNWFWWRRRGRVHSVLGFSSAASLNPVDLRAEHVSWRQPTSRATLPSGLMRRSLSCHIALRSVLPQTLCVQSHFKGCRGTQ